jgi:hypothetical protein|tara:strand:- start:270 stop:728 length:459 start_codon:yes stop_codon:yes gene_type:complete
MSNIKKQGVKKGINWLNKTLQRSRKEWSDANKIVKANPDNTDALKYRDSIEKTGQQISSLLDNMKKGNIDAAVLDKSIISRIPSKGYTGPKEGLTISNLINQVSKEVPKTKKAVSKTKPKSQTKKTKPKSKPTIKKQAGGRLDQSVVWDLYN